MVCGAGNFAVVYIAGIIFLNALTRLFHVSRNDIKDIDDEELMKSVKASAKGTNMKELFRVAKNIFMDMKRSGELDQVGGSVDINPEDDG